MTGRRRVSFCHASVCPRTHKIKVLKKSSIRISNKFCSMYIRWPDVSLQLISWVIEKKKNVEKTIICFWLNHPSFIWHECTSFRVCIRLIGMSDRRLNDFFICCCWYICFQFDCNYPLEKHNDKLKETKKKEMLVCALSWWTCFFFLYLMLTWSN
jgi:hypothetical protein